MKNFKKGGFQKGGGGFGGRPKFGDGKKFGGKFGGGRDGSDRPMRRVELFPAVCSKCGNKCEIPFRPTGDRPVYCRDCFVRPEQAGVRTAYRSEHAGRDAQTDVRPLRESRNQYHPEHARPQSEDGIAALKQQLAELNRTGNRILELVSQKPEPAAAETASIEEAPKKKRKASGKS